MGLPAQASSLKKGVRDEWHLLKEKGWKKGVRDNSWKVLRASWFQ